TLEPSIQEVVTDRAGVRIIFNGVSAGQLSFQEIWLSGTEIRSSIARNFDQFAKTVRVGLFDFEVVEVSDGKITLRYNIMERVPVKQADVAKVGLRGAGMPASPVFVIRSMDSQSGRPRR